MKNSPHEARLEQRVRVKRTQKAAVPPNTRRLKDFFLYLGTSVGVNIKVAASAVQPKDRSDKAGEGGASVLRTHPN